MRRGGRKRDARQPGGSGAGQRQNDAGRQQARRFRQRDGEAVEVGRAVTLGGERALHRAREVVLGVGDGADPAEIGALRQHDPGDISIIGPCFQRRGAARRDGHGRGPERRQFGQPGGVDGFGGGRKCGPARVFQHHGQTHAQVGPGRAPGVRKCRV